AAVRLCDGADHGVEAARADRDARTLAIPQGAPRVPPTRAPERGGAGLARAGAPFMSVASYDAAAAGARPSGTARASNLAPVLRVEHLSMRFGGLVAVNDFSFAARRGDITALIGPNGAGQTAVFNCITGFYKPSEGRIALQFGDPGVWEELSALTERGTRSVTRGDGMLFLLERMPDYLVAHRARVARTFQNIRLFQGMT